MSKTVSIRNNVLDGVRFKSTLTSSACHLLIYLYYSGLSDARTRQARQVRVCEAVAWNRVRREQAAAERLAQAHNLQRKCELIGFKLMGAYALTSLKGIQRMKLG